MESASVRAVLLVEPNPLVGALLGGFVHDAGFHAAHATDPVSAVRLHRQLGDIAVAIIEVDLPGPWNAHQLSEALRQNQPAVTIIMTSASTAGEAEAARSAIPFLRKPFDSDDVLALLPTLDRQLAA